MKSTGLEKMHIKYRELLPGKRQPSYPARIIQNGIVFMNSSIVDEFIKVENLILIRS